MNSPEYARWCRSTVAIFAVLGLVATVADAQTGASALCVDAARLEGLFDELSRFGGNAAGGVDRVAFSQADLGARARLAGRLEAAGLAVTTDAAGNLLACRAGHNLNTGNVGIGTTMPTAPLSSFPTARFRQRRYRPPSIVPSGGVGPSSSSRLLRTISRVTAY